MRIPLLLGLLLPLVLTAASERVEVGRFSAADLSGWQEKVFQGNTDYRLVSNSGMTVLEAISHGTASGRFKKVHIDLKQTPVMHWTWRAGNVLAGLDERTKGGDDYPARIYVVFSGGLLFWRTRAINYVWSSSLPAGTTWDNAFTANAKMVAVESGESRLRQWVTEKRDIAADYRQLFGDDADTVDAVAIMTDTDNSGQQAVACYGDIWFGAE